MTPVVLHTMRLTLGPATPAHGEAFIAFCATEAAVAARDWAYATHGLAPLVSLIDAGNAASIRVAEKLGARIEGPHTPNDGKPIMRWRHPGALA